MLMIVAGIIGAAVIFSRMITGDNYLSDICPGTAGVCFWLSEVFTFWDTILAVFVFRFVKIPKFVVLGHVFDRFRVPFREQTSRYSDCQNLKSVRCHSLVLPNKNHARIL